MRTIESPIHRVVIIGAGLGGLSCAIRLAAAGREVTIIERELIPGGRAGRLHDSGYDFDTGPTVLTAPELIQDLLDTVGESLEDWLRLTLLDPSYRAFFPDGSTLDVIPDTLRMAAEIAKVCGPREADGYLRFVDYIKFLWKIERTNFIEQNIEKPSDLLGMDLFRLARSGGFRRLSTKVNSFFRDPRTRRIFSFQSVYAGLAPHEALALYCVISYLDTVSGVYFPQGGIWSLSKSLADIAIKHGVTIRYGVPVDRIDVSGTRATGVILAGGERISTDAVVINPDLPIAYRNLFPSDDFQRPWWLRPVRYSPSCVVLHAGSTATYSKTAHHNIHFGSHFRSSFDKIIHKGQLMDEPSIFVTNATATDPGLAPPGKQTYFVLVLTPNTTSRKVCWDEKSSQDYKNHVLEILEKRGYINFSSNIEVSSFVTPLMWAQAGMGAGTPFALSHTAQQTGPFRPKNLHPRFTNVVFVGSSTQPGVGVPMVLISGKLAAQRITGI